MSGPKKSDYAASDTDITQVAIAGETKQHFRENFLPVMIEEAARAFGSEGALMNLAEGRANADVNQALSDNPNRSIVASVNTQADRAIAGADMQLQGTTQGLAGARSDQTAAVKVANAMDAQTQSGMATAAKIQTQDTLLDAKSNQTELMAGLGAFKVLGTQMGKNFDEYNSALFADSAKSKDSTAPNQADSDAGLFQILTGRGIGQIKTDKTV